MKLTRLKEYGNDLQGSINTPEDKKYMKPYKQVNVLSNPQDFEQFVNDSTVEIVSMDVRGCEQSVLFQYSFIAVVVFYRKPAETPGQVREECYADLKEIAHFFGGWDNLRKEIYHLEVGDNEPGDGEAWSGGIAENH